MQVSMLVTAPVSRLYGAGWSGFEEVGGKTRRMQVSKLMPAPVSDLQGRVVVG